MSNSRFTGSRFRKAVRYFVVGRAAQAVATLVVTLLAVRLLDPTPYGIYMILWGLVEVGSPLTSLGLLPAVQRFLPEMAERGTPERLRRFVLNMLFIRITLILLGAVGIGIWWQALSAWLGHKDSDPAVAWLGAGMIACVLVSRFSSEMLECLLEQRYAQTARALLPFVRCIGLLVLWLAGSVSLVAVLLIDLLAAAGAMVLGEVWLARAVKAQNPAGNFELQRRDFLDFVWHMSGAQLLNAASSAGTIRLVVAKLLGVEMAGQFSFMQQLVTIGNRYLPSVLLANMVRPMLITRFVTGKLDDVAVGFGVLWKANIAIVWPAIPLMLLSGDGLIALASGGRVGKAGLPMAVMMLGLAARGQNQIVVMAMQVYRQAALVRTVSFFGLASLMLLFVFQHLGLIGMAMAVTAGLLLRSTVGLMLLQQQSQRMQLDWNGAFRVWVAIGAASAAGWAAMRAGGPWWATAVVLLICTVVFTRMSRPVSGAEMSLLARGLGARSARFTGWSR